MTTKPPDQEKGVKASDEPEQIAVGTHVKVELLTASRVGELHEFDIVPDERADFAAGFLGAGTPLARAIIGERAGSEIVYGVADVAQVRIVSVSASVRAPSEDLPSERQAVIREAISRSNLVDAQRLALTVDVKWGDYDPEGIEANWPDGGGRGDQ